MNFGYALLGATIATSVCHPLDVLRVRVMVSSSKASGNPIQEMISGVKTQGISTLWTGLSAGLLRQVFYGTFRFGCFETLQDMRLKQKQGKPLSTSERFLFGSIAGGIAGFAGNPADVALTRMASDEKLPKEQRRGYKNGLEAMVRIGREDGFGRNGLLCGAWTNIQRSVLVNCVMLGTYSQSKEFFQQNTSVTSLPLIQFLAGTTSGFATAVLAVPADFIKTNLQHQLKSMTAMGLVRKVVAENGVLGLWRGFLPFFLKLAPHTTISFMVIENLKARFM